MEASGPSRFGEEPLEMLRCRCSSPNASKPHLEYHKEEARERHKEERRTDHGTHVMQDGLFAQEIKGVRVV